MAFRCLSLAITAFLVGAAHGMPQYSAVELAPALSDATAINDRGQVVGFVFTNSFSRPVLWDRRNMVDLGTLGEGFGFAEGINNSGQVVGGSHNASGSMRAFLWEHGRMIDLGVLPGMQQSLARAINDRGQIIGISWGSSTRAFLWEKGAMVDLGRAGTFRTHALRINERGQVLCNEWTPTGKGMAFLWDRGVISQLPNMGGPAAFAFDLNHRGQILGVGDTRAGDVHGFIWHNGVTVDLGRSGAFWSDFFFGPFRLNDGGQIAGTILDSDGVRGYLMENTRITYIEPLPETDSALPYALNNCGEIVGQCYGLQIRAFHWHRGVTTELFPPNGGNSPYPRAINNRGEIIGYCFNGGFTSAVLWLPSKREPSEP